VRAPARVATRTQIATRRIDIAGIEAAEAATRIIALSEDSP
jgi:hypothetical protein